jgi:CTP:molybdopterin cytidylyltransferase MocA
LSAGISDVIVVVGPEHEAIRREIDCYPVRIAINEKAGSEMAESVREGLASSPHVTGVLICLADHPLVRAGTLRSLIGTHILRPDKIVVPSYQGRRGHPCLFPFDAARQVFSGMNLRQIISENPARVEYVGVDDEGVVLDMDTEEDYRVMLEKFIHDQNGRNDT